MFLPFIRLPRVITRQQCLARYNLSDILDTYVCMYEYVALVAWSPAFNTHCRPQNDRQIPPPLASIIENTTTDFGGM